MATRQVHQNKRRLEDTIKRFSSPKSEDPLIKYWIQRKKDIEESITGKKE